jgi:hypothetical protein
MHKGRKQGGIRREISAAAIPHLFAETLLPPSVQAQEPHQQWVFSVYYNCIIYMYLIVYLPQV